MWVTGRSFRRTDHGHNQHCDYPRPISAGWPVPGMSIPYEEPLNPELLIEADRTFIPEAILKVEELINKLRSDL